MAAISKNTVPEDRSESFDFRAVRINVETNWGFFAAAEIIRAEVSGYGHGNGRAPAGDEHRFSDGA